MKIALISHEFPPFIFGGVGSNCYDLAYNLTKAGNDVTVFAGRATKIRNETVNSINVVRLPYFDFPPRTVWFQLNNLKPFSRLLNDYDIIHVVDTQSAIVPIYFAKKLGKPIVTSIHTVPSIYFLKKSFNGPIRDLSLGDIGYSFFEYPLRNIAQKYCLENSTHIVSCGFYAMEKMKTYLGLKPEITSVIYNGITMDDIKHNLQTRNQESPRIVFIGRLYYLKGLTYLLKALSLLKKEMKNFTLDIFGVGPLENALKKEILALGLVDQVNFRGFMSDKSKLFKEIEAATLVAMPSLLEVGPSISALEAMALKKPIVAFDTPFAHEFITDMQNGLLAKSFDEHDFAAKLSLLISDKKLCDKLGQNAWDYVKQNHDWSILIKQYIKIYNKLL